MLGGEGRHEQAGGLAWLDKSMKEPRANATTKPVTAAPVLPAADSTAVDERRTERRTSLPQEALEKARKAHADSSSREDSLAKERDQLASDLRSKTAEAEALAGEVEGLRNQVEELNGSLGKEAEERAKEKEEASGAASKLQQAIAGLEEEVERERGERERVEKELAEAREEGDKRGVEKEDALAKIALLESELGALREVRHLLQGGTWCAGSHLRKGCECDSRVCASK